MISFDGGRTWLAAESMDTTTLWDKDFFHGPGGHPRGGAPVSEQVEVTLRDRVASRALVGESPVMMAVANRPGTFHVRVVPLGADDAGKVEERVVHGPLANAVEYRYVDARFDTTFGCGDEAMIAVRVKGVRVVRGDEKT